MVNKIHLLFFLSSFLFACGFEPSTDKANLPTSSGKYGEVLVAVDTTYQKGDLKSTLDSIFLAPLSGLPQMEPQFRTSFVSPSSFKSILKRARNILKIDIKKESKNNVEVVRDVWAKDQLLIRVIASSKEDVARILKKNTQTLRDYFNEEEIKRLQLRHKGKTNQDANVVLLDKFNIQLDVPPGFVRMMDSSNGIWFKKEKQIGQHQVLQGFAIYTEDYNSDSTFYEKTMINSRNHFTKRFILGPRESSYMQVYDEFIPISKEVNLSGLYAVEYRGLWKMKNDFMGGPFLQYTFIDQSKNKVVHLDAFVYAPNFNKREYLRELEAILKSVSPKI